MRILGMPQPSLHPVEGRLRGESPMGDGLSSNLAGFSAPFRRSRSQELLNQDDRRAQP